MLPGPGDGGDGTADDAGLVFVSYSHADAVWAQRFRVLLKPLVRRERLRLWDDTEIRATEEWHPAIERAIARSRVALLLVSADFLASDYIMEQELPALVRTDVGLAPVLVADCFWSSVPELTTIQWLHDIEHDGALSLLADNPGARDRWIRRACNRLLAVVSGPGSGTAARLSHGSRPGVPQDPVIATDDGVHGPLSRVPAPPPGFVVREEQDGLVTAVLRTAGDGAVGVTGERAGTGLHGLGGIGKSVLAAAVAADDRIRRRHPDGVFWVTVGEHPDLLALQLDLLTRLGTRSDARTVTEATEALRTALAEKRVLLVVDDVWSDAAALAFRVTGRRGRVLYTSRDGDVVRAVGAAGHRLGVLSPAAARALAAAVLQVQDDALPDDADRAFAAVGRVPLAVALLAATVRGGGDWDEIADDLARDADVYATHPYADTFRALAIGAAALPDDLRTALFGLAVFPPDTAVPVAAVARYWASTRGRTDRETDADLDRLAAANLLRLDGDTAGFHDLAHEYLLLHADGLPLLHEQLLGAYRVLLQEPDEWWQLPPGEPYVWEHLARHLAAAGARRTLVATVTDPVYQACRIARDGPQAGESDLAVTARVTPADPVVAWWRTWLARHAHLFATPPTATSPRPRPGRTGATMLAWLTADPTRPGRVRAGRLAALLTRPYLAVDGGLGPPTRPLVRVLTGHTGWVRTVAWSPRGDRLATAGDDAVARLWDPVTGRVVGTLSGHLGPVTAAAWSPDGSRLVTAGDDATARVWDASTGRPLIVLTGHAGTVHAAAWSPDGATVATAGRDALIRLWNPDTGQDVGVLTGHVGAVTVAVWSPDGTTLATAGDDAAVRLWDATRGTVVRTLTGHRGPVRTAAWSPDSLSLVTAGRGRSVLVWDARTGSVQVTRTGHTRETNAIAWSPTGSLLATGGADHCVRVWDAADSRVMSTLDDHAGWVGAVAWSPDGTRLVSAGGDLTVRLWDVPALTTLAEPDGHSGSVRAVAWSPRGALLATGSADRTVGLWDARTGSMIDTLTGHTGWVRTVAWSADGTLLASGGDDSTVRLWDPTTGRCTATLVGHTGMVRSLTWSPDDAVLASGSYDGTVRLWRIATQRLVATFRGSARVRSVAWSPDGTLLAVAGGDGSVLLRDAVGGEVVANLSGSTHRMRALAWSPDGTRLAAGGAERTVVVWNVAARQATAVLSGHPDWVNALAWSPDGAHLVSADDSGTVVVWDRDGTERTSLVVQPVASVAWSETAIAVSQAGRAALLTLRDPADPAER